jgi:ABC-type multidrug transport system fused ATPase/permease subunit
LIANSTSIFVQLSKLYPGLPDTLPHLKQRTQTASMKMVSPHSPTSLGLLSAFVLATSVLLHPAQSFTLPSTLSTHSKTSSLILHGKKNKRKGGGGGGQQPRQEKQSVKDQRFDAATRQFMFTLTGLSKTLPDKSKKILDDIYLSFYPGAKIGIVGLNGSG